MKAAEPAKRGPKVKWTEKRIKTLIKKIKAYCLENAEPVPEVHGEGESVKVLGPKLPMLSECFKKSGFNSKYIYELAKQHPKLADALEKVRELSERSLINGALRGLYNPTFAIFAAKNMIGWRDEKQGPLVDQSQHTHFTVITDGQASNDQADSKANDRFSPVDQS